MHVFEGCAGPWTQWLVQPGGLYQPCGDTIARLPAGAYAPVQDCYGNIRYQAKPLQVDDLIDFEGSLPSRILQEINHFWTQGDRFARHGFLHRRGYLFHGKQGCGKSSLIHQITARIIETGHLTFFCEEPHLFIGALELFRKVEPARPIVCIFEDIDALIERFGDAALLQWLDGNHQVDRVVNLASTNYPEKLDPRIIARPRRFDRVLQIQEPDARQRAAYFARKMPEQPAEDRAGWVERTEGLPFAALAEVVISVCCLGNDLDDTIALLRRLDACPPANGQSNGGPARRRRSRDGRR